MLGIGFALGFLNKYNIVFLLLGMLPALLLTKQRQIFLKQDLYIALIIAFVLIAPNLYWQYQQNFPVLRHMEELSRTQLVHVNRLGFLKDQVLYFIGSIFVLLAAFLSFLLYKPFRPYRFVLYSYIFTICLFLYFRAKGYYAIGLYPVLLAFGAVYLSEVLDKGWRVYLKPLCLLVPILMFIPIVKAAFPIYTPARLEQIATETNRMHRWEDGKNHPLAQDFADMLGWSELARKVDSIYAQIPDKRHLIVFCDNYGQAGAVNFYKKTKTFAAMSFNADYINWFNLDHPIAVIIRIKEYDNDPSRLDGEHALFNKVTLAARIENEYAREHKTEIYVLTGPKADIKKFLEDKHKALLKANSL